jgi:4,4'-diaponeurosporenoate glycosyltransferase
MIQYIIEFVIVIVGLVMTGILFYRIPILPRATKRDRSDLRLSIIIPARNEEHTLPLLLQDLAEQELSPLEIICVDDGSEDSTAKVAAGFGVSVIRLTEKPKGWIGKSWACHNGSKAAKGELLLFLDADVRLRPQGIASIITAYEESRCTVSVQPYHQTKRIYESFSLLINLLQIAANGVALPRQHSAGIIGPAILISRSDYQKIGGHESVRNIAVEDMALGRRLRKEGLRYRIFVGNREVSFRMYAGGFRALFQGWVKNIATGATSTPPVVFAMVFLWMTSMISVPVQLLKFAMLGEWGYFSVYGILYVIWVILLVMVSRKIGKFGVISTIFYPVIMFVTLMIMTVSAYKKLFHRKVIWKGRDIGSEEKPCE